MFPIFDGHLLNNFADISALTILEFVAILGKERSTFVVEDITKFLIEQSSVEQFVNYNCDWPAVGLVWLGLSNEDFRGLVKSYFLFGFLLFGEGQLQIVSICGVEVHHEYFLWAQVLYLVLTQKFKTKFDEFQREEVFDFKRWIFLDEIAE